MNALEALNNLKNKALQDCDFKPWTLPEANILAARERMNEKTEEEYTILQNELKAFGIIKDFGVNVEYIKHYFHKGNGGYTAYKSDMKAPYLDFYPSEKMIDYEQFKLLKEVLEWAKVLKH